MGSLHNSVSYGNPARKKWVPVFGSLLKQSSGRTESMKKLLIFDIVLIVLICVYESIISSNVTTVPPYQIIQNFLELIESGYKIIGFGYYTENERIITTFNRSGILDKFGTSLVWGTDDFEFIQAADAVANCNASVPVYPPLFYYYKSYIEGSDATVKCHLVKEGSIHTKELFTVTMLIREPLGRVLVNLIEAGIVKILGDWTDFVSRLEHLPLVHLDHFRQYVLPRPFNMANIKILSVFQICGVLFCQAVLVVVVEYFSANDVIGCYNACAHLARELKICMRQRSLLFVNACRLWWRTIQHTFASVKNLDVFGILITAQKRLSIKRLV